MRFTALTLVLSAIVVASCGNMAHAPLSKTAAVRPPPEPDDPILTASCARGGSWALPARASGRQGSAVALARRESMLLAYVADADSRAIHTISIDDRKELARTDLDGAPRQLVVMADGRVVATLSDGARIAVLEPFRDPTSPMAVRCQREVPAEPWGIALSPDEATLAVASGWGAALSAIDAKSFVTKSTHVLPRDPRSVLIDDDGIAYVSHAVGKTLTAVDLARGTGSFVDLSVTKMALRPRENDKNVKRTATQGYALARVSRKAKQGRDAQRILAPMVSVDAGDPIRGERVYYGPPFDGVPKETPIVGVIDPDRRELLMKQLLGTSTEPYARECLLPRAAAVREKTGSLFVACYGIDTVLELDAWSLDPIRTERARIGVPTGPEGIAVDEESGRVVVFSQMGAAVTVIDANARKSGEIAVDYRPDATLAAHARGRELFYRTDDTRISNDGIACASCHPDGRDDGVTWSTPSGARQTMMLAGRVKRTAPYGWDGGPGTLPEYIHRTSGRLGGRGLEAKEQEDLAGYLAAMRGPAQAKTRDRALVARGKDVFESQECNACHAGETTTDGKLHDVGTSAALDTPSLRFVSGTAPYFHDGRFSSLEQLLEDKWSTMGQTWKLSMNDRSALTAYLQSLGAPENEPPVVHAPSKPPAPIAGFRYEGPRRPAMRTVPFDVASLPVVRWRKPETPAGFAINKTGEGSYRLWVKSTIFAEVIVSGPPAVEFAAFAGGSFWRGAPPDCGSALRGDAVARWSGFSPVGWTDREISVELGDGTFDRTRCTANAHLVAFGRARAVVPGHVYGFVLRHDDDGPDDLGTLMLFMPRASMVAASADPAAPLMTSNTGLFTRLSFRLKPGVGHAATLRVTGPSLGMWGLLRQAGRPVFDFADPSREGEGATLGVDVATQGATHIASISYAVPAITPSDGVATSYARLASAMETALTTASK